jgi:hypothetical protein
MHGRVRPKPQGVRPVRHGASERARAQWPAARGDRAPHARGAQSARQAARNEVPRESHAVFGPEATFGRIDFLKGRLRPGSLSSWRSATDATRRESGRRQASGCRSLPRGPGQTYGRAASCDVSASKRVPPRREPTPEGRREHDVLPGEGERQEEGDFDCAEQTSVAAVHVREVALQVAVPSFDVLAASLEIECAVLPAMHCCWSGRSVADTLTVAAGRFPLTSSTSCPRRALRIDSGSCSERSDLAAKGLCHLVVPSRSASRARHGLQAVLLEEPPGLFIELDGRTIEAIRIRSDRHMAR